MKTLLRVLLVLCAFRAVAAAANIPISVIGSTETQIVVSFVPTASGCTVTAVDNNGGPTVNDVDPAKFPSANVIASRTNANGFRWPSYMRGNSEVVIIGGHDEVKQGLDGAWYSTALQVASDHTITIACGSDSGTIHVQTQNIPLGSYYPEIMIPQPSFFGDGSWPQPTIDYSTPGRAKQYVDPITGVLITRMSDGVDNLNDGGCCGTQTIFTTNTRAMDQTSSWTNPQFGTTASTSPTNFAVTSTPNAVLFLPIIGGFSTSSDMSLDDYRVQLYGKGTSGSEVLGISITEDSGQTAASGEVQVPMSTTSGCQTYSSTPSDCAGIPNIVRQSGGTPIYTGSTGTFPQGQFSDWGGGLKNAYAGTWEIFNNIDGTISNVSVNGSTVTSNNSTIPGFNVGRKAGSLFYLDQCASGGPLLLHRSTVDSYTQITTTETGQTASGCRYTDLAAGIRIVLKNPGTVQVAAIVSHAEGRGGTQATDGVRWLCARSKVTDISTDCDGVIHAPATSGLLCSLDGVSSIYLVQDNGRVCLQSNGYGNATAGHVVFPASPFITNNTVLAQVANSSAALYTLKFPRIPGNYKEYQPGLQHDSTQPDNATYTAVPLSPSAVTALVKSTAGVSPEALKALNSGLWGNPTLQTIIDNPRGDTGLLWGWFAKNQSDPLCMFAVTDAVNSTPTVMSTFATWNNSNGDSSSSCHNPPYGIAGYQLESVVGTNAGGMAPNNYNTGALLGGPFISRGVGLHRPDGTFQLWQLPSITAASNASPLVLTFSAVTDLDNVGNFNANNGSWATCSGGTGAWAALNGTVYLHNPSTMFTSQNTTASVYADAKGQTPINSTSWGSFGGQTITCSVMPPVYGFAMWRVLNTGSTGLANSGFVRVTPLTVDTGYQTWYPSQQSPIRDGDPIALTGLGLTTQYYAKQSCTNCNGSGTVNTSGTTVTKTGGTPFATSWAGGVIVINGVGYGISSVGSTTSMTLLSSAGTLTGATYSLQQFDVYTDAALSQPLAYTGTVASNILNGYVAYAETCPDPGTLDLSWSFKDSGIGTTGNPLVRCVTVRLNTEPCSDYASAGEGGGSPTPGPYPCPSDPSNSSRSSLHNIHVGDGVYDLSHRGNNHEIMPVVAENKASETQIDVTLERWYGDIVGRGQSNGVCGYITLCQQDNYANSHAPGWTPWQWATNYYYYFDINTLNSPALPSTVGSGHTDMAYGATLTNLSYAQSYLPGDSFYNLPITQMFTTNTSVKTQNNYPLWNGDNTSPISNQYCYGGCQQTYTDIRQVPGVAAVQDSNWFADWAANNPDNGAFENAVDGLAFRTSFKIRGTPYDSGNTTTIVYKITPVGNSSAAGIKTFPLMVVNGVHQYLFDASSPGACLTGGEGGCLTDISNGAYCRAYNAGECRPNSSAGDIFVAIRGTMDPYGQCVSSNNTLPIPCAVVSSPIGGWAIQQRINPPTTDGSGIRRLTLGFHAPLEHGDYSNWLISPDAHWGFFAMMPVNAHAHYKGKEDMHWWMMKLPPWAPYDNVKRSSFVNVPVTFSGMSGDTYRIKFWYGENGLIGNNTCTTRAEFCWTSDVRTTTTQSRINTDTTVTVASGVGIVNNDLLQWGNEVVQVTAGGGTTSLTISRAAAGTTATSHASGSSLVDLTAFSSANPFVFDNETQRKTSCDSGCMVRIPAIPGRILFYQVERTHGGIATLGAVETVAVP